MKNLKDKLSASVRQAKAGMQPATKATAHPVAKPAARSSRAAAGAAVAPTAPAAPRPRPSSAGRPVAAQGTPSQGAGAFAFPDRVWPD